MNSLAEDLRQEPIDQFGYKIFVDFEPTERIIYSHNMGSLPQIIDKSTYTVPKTVVGGSNKANMLPKILQKELLSNA